MKVLFLNETPRQKGLMYFIFAKVILKQARKMFQRTLTKETLDT
jgi:hypothetical protein